MIGDTLQAILTFIAIITAVYSLFKSSDDRKKTKTETLKLYNDMLTDSANRETKLKEEIGMLEAQVNDLKKIIETKDGRIEELQELTQKQEQEIRSLRKELEVLKSQKC